MARKKKEIKSFREMTPAEQHTYFLNTISDAIPFSDEVHDTVHSFLIHHNFIRPERSKFFHIPGNQLCIELHNQCMILCNGNQRSADSFTIWFNSRELRDIKTVFNAINENVIDYRNIYLRVQQSETEEALDSLPG